MQRKRHRQRPRWRFRREARLFVEAADAQVFHFEEFLDTVLRALASDAGLLHAAERRDLGRDDADINADDARLYALGDAPHAAYVPGIEVCGKAIFGVVGELEELVLGLEAVQRRYRSEGLLMRDL